MLIYVGFCCICVGFYVIRSIFVGNECCLFWVGTGYPLTCATLYTHFSESKRRRSKECKTKDFRGSNAAAKAWLRGGFHSKECKRAPKPICPSESSKTLVLHCPHSCVAKSPRDRRADMGFCTKLQFYRHKCYFLYTSTVNRTYFSALLACAR